MATIVDKIENQLQPANKGTLFWGDNNRIYHNPGSPADSTVLYTRQNGRPSDVSFTQKSSYFIWLVHLTSHESAKSF